MIDYGVCVSTYKTYAIKRLDSDYFNEDASLTCSSIFAFLCESVHDDFPSSRQADRGHAPHGTHGVRHGASAAASCRGQRASLRRSAVHRRSLHDARRLSGGILRRKAARSSSLSRGGCSFPVPGHCPHSRHTTPPAS